MNYETKLERFRRLFEEHSNDRLKRIYPDRDPNEIQVEFGYKFDKVFVFNGQKAGRYMVESRSGKIWGIKSWTQVNYRRQFGTLDTVDQYDWSEYSGRPIPGTDAEIAHIQREEEITAGHKKRGRKPKLHSLSQ